MHTPTPVEGVMERLALAPPVQPKVVVDDEQLKKLQKDKKMLEDQLQAVSEECERLQDLVDEMEAERLAAALSPHQSSQSNLVKTDPGAAAKDSETLALIEQLNQRAAEAERKAEEAEAERQQILELLEAAESHIQELMRHRRGGIL